MCLLYYSRSKLVKEIIKLNIDVSLNASLASSAKLIIKKLGRNDKQIRNK